MRSLIRQSLLAEGGCLRIKGYSMFPLFISGTTVHVVNADPFSLSMGDVVLVTDNNSFQIHRLIRPIQEGKFQTAGDFTRGADMPLSISYLSAKVVIPHNFFQRMCDRVMCAITLWRYS